MVQAHHRGGIWPANMSVRSHNDCILDNSNHSKKFCNHIAARNEGGIYNELRSLTIEHERDRLSRTSMVARIVSMNQTTTSPPPPVVKALLP